MGQLQPFYLNQNLPLKFSPNPTKSTLVLNYKNTKSSNLNIRVYNVIGKTIYSKELDFDKTTGQYIIDVSEWVRGVYFFKWKKWRNRNSEEDNCNLMINDERLMVNRSQFKGTYFDFFTY